MTVERGLQSTIGTLAQSAPILSAYVRRRLQSSVNIVYAHYAGEPVPYFADFWRGLTVDRFDAILTDLARRFRFVTLAEALADDGPAHGGKPTLAVTFDDGFDLIAGGVADVLDRHDVRATSFLITSCLDNRRLMWRHSLSAARALTPDPSTFVAAFNGVAASARLPQIRVAGAAQRSAAPRPHARKDELADAVWERCDIGPPGEYLAAARPYFDDAGVRDWLRRGHTIGLHTHTHPHCGELGADDVIDEIERPAAWLRERYELDRVWFSYPFGSRLPDALERDVCERGAIDCALGIEGFASRGTPLRRLERSSLDGVVAFSVYGRVLLGRGARPNGLSGSNTAL